MTTKTKQPRAEGGPRPVASSGKLEGRNMLLTGGNHGIGYAIAQAAFRAGASVTVLSPPDDTTSAPIEPTPRGQQPDLRTVACDLSDPEQIDTTLDEIRTSSGPIDILVNNTSANQEKANVNLMRRMWEEVVDANLSGCLRLTDSVIPEMAERGWGRVINVGAAAGQVGMFSQAHFSAARGPLFSFTMSLANDVARKGITVNAVWPGYIDSGATEDYSDLIRQQISMSTPMGRMGRPEEVAEVVVFLASNDASYMTGQVIAVNGGLYM
jgi:NAD(P)-dependent dehydrogenase (short-subunit alcohol dehydrogenase family)